MQWRVAAEIVTVYVCTAIQCTVKNWKDVIRIVTVLTDTDRNRPSPEHRFGLCEPPVMMIYCIVHHVCCRHDLYGSKIYFYVLEIYNYFVKR